MMHAKTLLLGTCCGLALTAGTMTAPAAQPAATAAFQPEEIVVTARRRVESLQEVPIAVSVLTGGDIEKLGITRVADFITLVPNVIFDNALNLGTNYLTIRGQTQSQYAPPPAAIIVDGVLTISPLQFNVDEFDLAQVEVLKGPQGAMYGRNAIAGAINLTTRKPGDDFEARFVAGYGRGEDVRARGAVSGPLVAERLSAGVGVSFSDRRGQIRNVTTGKFSDHYDDTTARARVVAKPSDNVELDLKYTYADTKGGDPAYITSRSGDPARYEDPLDSNRIGSNPRELHDASGKLEWSGADVTVSAILAYVDVAEDVAADFDFSRLDAIRVAQEQNESGFSQELRVASNRDGALRWLVGGYHVKNKRELGADIFADPFFFGLIPAPIGANFLIQTSDDTNRYENYSGFGQLEYELSDRWELALALRYDEDSNEQNRAIKAKFSKWQPKATLTYKADGDVVMYSSIGQGFRAGDFNASGSSFGERVIKAESATTYEIGVKSRLFAGRTIANGAVFYTDLKNGQFKLFDTGGATNVGINIGKTRLQGFEIETVTALTESLSLNAALGYTDASVKSFAAPRGYPASTATYVGNTPPRVPDYSLNLALAYDHPVSEALRLLARADYRRIGTWFWDLENDYRRPAANDLQFRLGLREADDAWAVTGWVKNALGEHNTADYQPVTNSGHPLGIDVYYPAAGATYGIEVSLRF